MFFVFLDVTESEAKTESESKSSYHDTIFRNLFLLKLQKKDYFRVIEYFGTLWL